MPLTDYNTSIYWANQNPKCPFCDRDIDIHQHELFKLYEEGEHEIECPYCEKEITVQSSCSFSFSTDQQPE